MSQSVQTLGQIGPPIYKEIVSLDFMQLKRSCYKADGPSLSSSDPLNVICFDAFFDEQLAQQAGLSGNNEFTESWGDLPLLLFAKAWALTEMEPSETCLDCWLYEKLKNGDERAMVKAGILLSHRTVPNIGFEPILLKLASHANLVNRASGIRGLGLHTLGSEKVIEALIKALTDTSPIVRGEAAIALGRFGGKAIAAVEPLLMLLESKAPGDFRIKEVVIDSLGRIGPRATPAINPLLLFINSVHWTRSDKAAAAAILALRAISPAYIAFGFKKARNGPAKGRCRPSDLRDGH